MKKGEKTFSQTLKQTLKYLPDRTPDKPLNPYHGRRDLKLNLGCGRDIRNGYINIDKDIGDLYLDLEKAVLPFDNGSVSEIVANQFFEHIVNFIPLMNEIHRVLGEGGILKITVPCSPSSEAFQDPTHIRFFTEKTFNYFLKGDGLYEDHGSVYGIKPFSWMVINKPNWMLTITLKK
jgi:SAM-dependent methyltransferase